MCSILPSHALISIRLTLQVQDVHLSPFSISYLTHSQGQEKAVPLSCFPHLSLFCFLKVPTALEMRRKHFKNYSYWVLILCQLCLLKPYAQFRGTGLPFDSFCVRSLPSLQITHKRGTTSSRAYNIC